MNDIDDVLARLRNSPRVTIGTGATDQEIAAAERSLDLTLPNSVRCYLNEVGWLSFGAHEIFGLGPGIAPYLHLVEVTLSERTMMQPGLPRHLLPLENDGSGSHYCVDTRSPTAPIVFFSHELAADQLPARVASSFSAWLLAVLDAEEQ